MKTIINVNGNDEIVEVCLYTEGCSPRTSVRFRNESIDIEVKAECTGGNDEYGYEFRAEDLEDCIDSFNIKS